MTTEETDVIIIGAGAAGSVIAARLSEQHDLRVDVVEAGPKDHHPLIHVPAGFIKMIFNPDYIWPFQTEATHWTAGRAINVLQGRVVGGSSSINGLIYNRGQAADFDLWAKMGNPGWDYASVLPYFIKSEHYLGDGASTFRGQGGSLKISDCHWHHPLCERFIQGAQELGIPANPDYNGSHQEGVGYFQRIIAGRRRVSAARAFLIPALKRPNLRLRTHCCCERIVFDGKLARGIEYRNAAGELRRLMARKHIVLCAGTVNTPRVLQLSGVGDASQLSDLGIPALHNLPGVGKNLRDHFSVRVVARAKHVATINELSKGTRLLGQIARWAAGKPGILTLSPSVVHIFAKSCAELAQPDLQGVFTPASYKAGFVSMLDDFPGMTCGFWQHRPQSSGEIRVRDPNPQTLPLIQPNYLAHEHDRNVLLAGIKLARQLLQTSPLQTMFDVEQLPGKEVQSDDELLDYARHYGVSSWHLIGTAKMGSASDAHAVVDARLKVHGLGNLRIADASVMPMSPSANTFAASVMIGERAADWVKEEIAA